MSKWISAKTSKAFALSIAIWVLVVLLNYLSPVAGDGVFAQRFSILLYIAPALILAATIFDIYRERARKLEIERKAKSGPPQS